MDQRTESPEGSATSQLLFPRGHRPPAFIDWGRMNVSSHIQSIKTDQLIPMINIVVPNIMTNFGCDSHLRMTFLYRYCAATPT